ncbi:MAG: SpoIIE family protein phosphatase [candidate division KSB1 bacterium]|nr:SpoIIE family protein phosphatase [candidate division KSB1 bacterium]MDZ7364880.1 SpoIIE family protein phosphatase [candidate division KSB1 bacterium]MDZ7402983.1 SpoIIE family protein phosphatase [candidate division KSB1 bacterium]
MFKSVTKEQLKVPAHIDYLADLRDFVTRIGKKHGFSDRVINAFKLAIDEAGTNVMRHAYRDVGGEGFITIRAIVKTNSLTICLIDQGKYFDPKHVKDPDLQRYVDIGKKGGLGIFIMRRLMDEIDYRKTEEGNELRLTKNRDTPAQTTRLRGQLPKVANAFKAIPLSLKAKYWTWTTLALTGIIGLGYGYFFWQAAAEERKQFFDDFRGVSEPISRALSNASGIFTDPSGAQGLKAVREIYKSDEVRRIVHEIVIVDSMDAIIGHVDSSRLIERFELPTDRTEVLPKIFAYTIPDPNNPTAAPEIYDQILPLGSGRLHIRVLRESLDRGIRSRRWAYARDALLLLAFSSVGTFLLIYILMNPFRKLADWVRRADHGDIEDEMDIDASTEIGEIAQAFSEITNKFRESQKNLAEQERLQKEMQVAQEIQQTLLPNEFPDLEGYEIASYYEAAREVGGDYFDFVEVDKDTLGIVVADVSGKGVPGSLVMTMIRTALRTEARGLKDAAEVLSRVNDFVIGDMKKGMFVTVFYVIIDGKHRRLNYASAGHNPMILYRASTKKTYYLNPRGFPIGIQLHEKDLFKKSIESDTIQLAEDDILLIYTDGITEAMNARRELFGEERLLKIFRDSGHLRVKPFVEQIKEEILSFTEGFPQSDDITLVAIREKTSPEKEELRRAKEAHTKILAGASIREACESVGITTYAYYNKYKKEFEEKGAENYEIEAEVSVEAKHIAIEDKVKIYDIIKNHPEYGAKRLSEELNTEKYGFTLISESKIYDELVRSRLNTRQLREAFVARGGRTRRPMKQPGTPMLTLDGKIILDTAREVPRDETFEMPSDDRRKSRLIGTPDDDSAVETVLPTPLAPAVAMARSDSATEEPPRKDIAKSDIDVRTLQTPLEELLDKKRRESEFAFLPDESGPRLDDAEPPVVPRDESAPDQYFEQSELPPVSLDESPDMDETPSPGQADAVSDKPPAGMLEISFEDLFAGGSILEDQSGPSMIDADETPFASAPSKEIQSEGEPAEEEASFFAVDDILRQELDGNFSNSITTIDDDGTTAAPHHDHAGATPSEMDLPYVDVHEILQQDGATSSVRLVDEPTAENKASASVARENGNSKEARTDYGRREPPAAPERKRDGVNGLAPSRRREDEREHLLIAGLRHYKNQRFQEAIAEFENAIRLYPDFKEAYSILGNAYFRNRMFDAAAKAYMRVKEMDPYDTTAYENMGVIYANRGDFLDAIKEWQRVLEIDPNRDDIRRKIERASRMLTRKAVA